MERVFGLSAGLAVAVKAWHLAHKQTKGFMLKVRENLYIATNVNSNDIENNKINRIVIIGEVGIDNYNGAYDGVTIVYLPLKDNRQNASHLKDLACHVPKYMCQNGDVVLLVDDQGGLGAAAYIAARLVCELEGKSIYDVFMEIKEQAPEFDIGAAYY